LLGPDLFRILIFYKVTCIGAIGLVRIPLYIIINLYIYFKHT